MVRGWRGIVAVLNSATWGRINYRIKLNRDWIALLATAERRRDVARVALDALYAKIPENTAASAELLVNFHWMTFLLRCEVIFSFMARSRMF